MVGGVGWLDVTGGCEMGWGAALRDGTGCGGTGNAGAKRDGDV